MSTSTTEDLPPAAEVIELEPTMHVDRAELWAESASGSYQPGPAVGIGEGSLASLAGETETLRRRRLLAAAVFLAATFGLLLVWVFASDNPGTLTVEGSRYSLRVGLIGLRCLLAAAVAGLLASEAPLTRKQLRVVEYVLFLGVTLVLMVSQYFVGLDLMHRGPEYLPIILAFIKDGVIQMLALMMIYGTLIPNPPAVAARCWWRCSSVRSPRCFYSDCIPTRPRSSRSSARPRRPARTSCSWGSARRWRSTARSSSTACAPSSTRPASSASISSSGSWAKGGWARSTSPSTSCSKRPCALKLIKPEAGADPIALARFEREVQSAARLAHPNTIEIYDYGHTDDGTFYYVMEYLQGLSLADLVRQAGPLPPGRVIYLFRQVCAGLAEAHGLGLVHRDLKPANVFVAVRGGESDVAKVLDFGLVKLTQGPGRRRADRAR